MYYLCKTDRLTRVRALWCHQKLFKKIVARKIVRCHSSRIDQNSKGREFEFHLELRNFSFLLYPLVAITLYLKVQGKVLAYLCPRNLKENKTTTTTTKLTCNWNSFEQPLRDISFSPACLRLPLDTKITLLKVPTGSMSRYSWFLAR